MSIREETPSESLIAAGRALRRVPLFRRAYSRATGESPGRKESARCSRCSPRAARGEGRRG